MTTIDDVEVRPVGPIHTPDSWEDAKSVMRFFNQPAIKQDLHWFTHRDTIERAYEWETRKLYYYPTDDTPIAALMIWCESRVLEDFQAQIRQVAVDPSFRNAGYGTALCRQAEQFAREHNKSEMVADAAAEENATQFWSSIGYDAAYTWETDSGRQMIRFRKEL